MAVSIKKKQEIEKRVNQTGEFFLNSECSFREIAEIFSNDPNYFNVSHITIRDYIMKYKNEHPQHAKKIDEIIETNKGSKLTNDEVISRISKVYNLLVEGNTIENISNILNESYWVIYYDINLRMDKIDNMLYKNAKELVKLNDILNKKSK